MILDKIIETKKEEVERLNKETSRSELLEKIAVLKPCRNFRNLLKNSGCNIIAELKCASPSRGRLAAKFDHLNIARTYEKNGAAAISILTDEKYFMGHKNYLTQISQVVKRPLLRKDFIIDPLQVYETRAIGADAILLIVRVLGKKLEEFITLAQAIGLYSLVEVHTREELEMALDAGADIIGINNRDLDTFAVDVKTSCRLQAYIPEDKITVSESGIRERKDIEFLMQSGIHAFLIGEHLVTATDIGQKLRDLRGEDGNDPD
jgi:indole-3-glycerol phosphate synthase